MTVHSLPSVAGGQLEVDLCFACRGIWFDPLENLKLSPAAVVDLFKLLHAHRHEGATALPHKLACPHCHRALTQGFDVVKSGRYITHRCAQRHGRFSTFASFMIEKGFVRQLTTTEIDDMAQRLAVINCSNCGAPVDLRTDHACPHAVQPCRCWTRRRWSGRWWVTNQPRGPPMASSYRSWPTRW